SAPILGQRQRDMRCFHDEFYQSARVLVSIRGVGARPAGRSTSGRKRMGKSDRLALSWEASDAVVDLRSGIFRDARFAALSKFDGVDAARSWHRWASAALRRCWGEPCLW